MPVADEVNFAYHLASNEPNVRRRTMSKLVKWISTKSAHVKTEFTEESMMKLWKGLYFCMWMTDKPLVQQETADNISALIRYFKHQQQALMFIDTFFKTMAHEWFAIDRYRLDKFMMLVRRFFRQSLVFTHAGGWTDERIRSLNACLGKTVLHPSSDDTPLGLKTHIADIFLQELARVHGHELTAEQANLFLEPFFNILVKTPLMVFRKSVRDNIFHLMMDLDTGSMEQAEEVSSEGKEETKHTDELESHSDSEEEYDEDGMLLEKSETSEDLPAVPFDYEMIAKRFLECSKIKKMRAPNRYMIANLFKKFSELSQGVNPRHNIDEDSGSDLELTEKDIELAAKRLKEEEQRELMLEQEELKRLTSAKSKSTQNDQFGLDTGSGVYEHLTMPGSSESGSDADTESADEEVEAVQAKKKLKQRTKRNTGKPTVKGIECCDEDSGKEETGEDSEEEEHAGGDEATKKRKEKKQVAVEDDEDAYYEDVLSHHNEQLYTAPCYADSQGNAQGKGTKKVKKRKKGAKDGSAAKVKSSGKPTGKGIERHDADDSGKGETGEGGEEEEHAGGDEVAKKRKNGKQVAKEDDKDEDVLSHHNEKLYTAPCYTDSQGNAQGAAEGAKKVKKRKKKAKNSPASKVKSSGKPTGKAIECHDADDSGKEETGEDGEEEEHAGGDEVAKKRTNGKQVAMEDDKDEDAYYEDLLSHHNEQLYTAPCYTDSRGNVQGAAEGAKKVKKRKKKAKDGSAPQVTSSDNPIQDTCSDNPIQEGADFLPNVNGDSKKQHITVKSAKKKRRQKKRRSAFTESAGGGATPGNVQQEVGATETTAARTGSPCIAQNVGMEADDCTEVRVVSKRKLAESDRASHEGNEEVSPKKKRKRPKNKRQASTNNLHQDVNLTERNGTVEQPPKGHSSASPAPSVTSTSVDALKTMGLGAQGLQARKQKRRRKKLLDLDACENAELFFEDRKGRQPQQKNCRSPLKEAQRSTKLESRRSDSPPRAGCGTGFTKLSSSQQTTLKKEDRPEEKADVPCLLGKVGGAAEDSRPHVKLTPQKDGKAKSDFAQFDVTTATPTTKFVRQSHKRARTEKQEQIKKTLLKKRHSESFTCGKKVNFLLSRNQAQDPKEYLESLKASPQIPFDASKKPVQGVLKVGDRSKQTPSLKFAPPHKRRRASDFF